jgi:hypothetical protein
VDYDYPVGTKPAKQRQVAQIAWSIFLKGGYKSESGSATSLLAADLQERGVKIAPAALSKLLNDIDEDESKTPCLYGPFCRRDVRGKRTFAILPVSIPGTDPFPPNPFDTVEESEEESDDDVMDFEMTHPIEVEREVVSAEPVSVADRLLFAASVIFECVRDLAAPTDFDQQIAGVVRLTEDNVRLRQENDALAKTNATLRRAMQTNGATGRLINA